MINILTEMANLLEPYGVLEYPSLIREEVARLQATPEDQVPSILRQLYRGLYRELLDLLITWRNGHNIKEEEEEEVNGKFRDLRLRLFYQLEPIL